MSDLLTELRGACADVATHARHVAIDHGAVPAYAAALPTAPPSTPDGEPHPTACTREEQVAFCVTLDAINFGSGWFPTLRKRPGHSGYFTIALGLRDRFEQTGAWSTEELREMTPATVAETLGQDSEHELMGLFAGSLRDLGDHVADEFDASFATLLAGSGGSAVKLVDLLSRWQCFDDRSSHGSIQVPFLKRAQITAADLHRSGLAVFSDLPRLTMFADNLVPHVLRLDGVLEFTPELADRIDRGELIEHGSPEEVEIRACALHAVELIVASQPGRTAAEVDEVLWRRGQEPSYKARRRHRSRCTAY